MKRDIVLTKPITSSFLSCEKDAELILRKLFIESRPYSDLLKRLLVVQAPDAIDKEYDVSNYTLKKLIDEKYIVLTPRIEFPEHGQVKSFITLNFDDFIPNHSNTEFRDHKIYIDVACHNEFWNLNDYRQRPFKIMGYIDGILNNSKLTGIGEVHLIGASMTGSPSPNWTCFTMSYLTINGSDDQIPNAE